MRVDATPPRFGAGGAEKNTVLVFGFWFLVLVFFGRCFGRGRSIRRSSLPDRVRDLGLARDPREPALVRSRTHRPQKLTLLLTRPVHERGELSLGVLHGRSIQKQFIGQLKGAHAIKC